MALRKKPEAQPQEGPKLVKLVKLVKMVRDEGEPCTADVHPDNVQDMLAHGWRVEE